MANQLACVVFLNKYKKNLVVPVSWCSPFDLADSVNEGLNRHINRKIFYSNDITAQPQFEIGIAASFDENVPGCHWGKMHKCYRTIEEAISDHEKRRSRIPPVYNTKKSSGRTTAQLHLLTPQEFDVAMAETSTALIGRAETKIEGFRTEVSSLRKRCAERRPQNYESFVDIDDSDIEDIQDDIGDIDSDTEIELLMPKPVKEENDDVCDSSDNIMQPHDQQNISDNLNSLVDFDTQPLNSQNVHVNHSVDGDVEPPNGSNVNDKHENEMNSLERNMQPSSSYDAGSSDNLRNVTPQNSPARICSSNDLPDGSVPQSKNTDVDVISDRSSLQSSTTQDLFAGHIAVTQTNEEEVDIMNSNENSFSSDSAQQDINDAFSGNLKYVEDMNGDRFFTEASVTISRSILGLLTAWNIDKPYFCAFYDQQFVSILLKHVFGKNLMDDNLDEIVLDFVRQIFEYRVNYDENRVAKFNDLVQKKRQKQKEKCVAHL